MGFSGYNDDENETISAATSPDNSELPPKSRHVISDINRNAVQESAHRTVVDNTSAAAQSPSKHVDARARERRDENNVDERRDTPSQVNNRPTAPVRISHRPTRLDKPGLSCPVGGVNCD